MSRIYDASVFDVANVDEAKRIILTPENSTTEERWQVETPYLAALITEHLPIDRGTLLLDYGCGIGRMSKALIERKRCKVVGADISASMRALAGAYVVNLHYLSGDWLRDTFRGIFPTDYPANCLSALDGLAFAPATEPIYQQLVDAGIIEWALSREMKGSHARENLIQRMCVVSLGQGVA